MPLPAAPAASESTTTQPTDDVPPVTGAQLSRTVVRSWEEPHPGSPIRLDPGGVYSGSSRGGMTAKGYGPYARGKPSGARRRSRIRARSAAVKPLEIPSRVQEKEQQHQPEIRSAPLPMSPLLTLGETLLMKGPASNNSPAMTLSPVADAASEAGSGATLRTSGEELLTTDPKDIPSPALPAPCLTFTDFSNFAGETVDANPPGFGELTVYDPESFGDAFPEQDMYGWDAELERKLQGGYQIETCNVRPPLGLKRGFIQRVFSFGGTPRDIHFSE